MDTTMAPAEPMHAIAAGDHPIASFAKKAFGSEDRRLPLTVLVVICLCCGSMGGCSSLGRPDWLAPGPARNQQRRAVRFDPYMQDDVGPYLLRLPLVDGGRPRDYAEPVPEVRRARWWAAGR